MSMNWQPISTAPIEAFGTVPSYYSFRALVYPCYGQAREAYFSYTLLGKGRWKSANGFVINTPTHWMPLPAPPQVPEYGQEGK